MPFTVAGQEVRVSAGIGIAHRQGPESAEDLHWLSPGEVLRLAAGLGLVRVGSAVGGLREQTSSKIRPRPPATVEAVVGARVGIDSAVLTPAMLATLKHAASMANPAFYDPQRRRMSTWGVPRFLHGFDEQLL